MGVGGYSSPGGTSFPIGLPLFPAAMKPTAGSPGFILGECGGGGEIWICGLILMILKPEDLPKSIFLHSEGGGWAAPLFGWEYETGFG